MIFTTQRKGRVATYKNKDKTKIKVRYKQNYTCTKKSITSQLVIGENGQRGTINNAQALPLVAQSMHT